MDPTILDLLGLKNITNHFLGSSLFNDKASYWETVSIVNNSFVNTENGNTIDLDSIGEERKKEFADYYSFESF